MQNKINGAQAINKAIYDSMLKSKKVLCFGLGVTDPKGVFGTTLGLENKFGRKRVFDTPTSENAMTGVGIGLSIGGFRPIMVHQRLDFFILALDQLINSAAKFYYMYGGNVNVPLVIRLIIGRGWGQGPTHSQSLINLFASIPGLKVVSPSSASSAYKLLVQSIEDPNPVVFIEHRWIHGYFDFVDNLNVKISKLSDIDITNYGNELAIISTSYYSHEARIAADILNKNNIRIKVIDILTIKPLNENKIVSELKKIKKILILDIGFEVCSLAGHLSNLIQTKFPKDKITIKIIDSGDLSEPTSHYLTKSYYKNYEDIIKASCRMLDIKFHYKNRSQVKYHDIPNKDFQGPF